MVDQFCLRWGCGLKEKAIVAAEETDDDQIFSRSATSGDLQFSYTNMKLVESWNVTWLREFEGSLV